MTYEIQIASSEIVLDEISLIIYGDSGIGKTTIAKNMPNPLFLIFRGGGEHRPMPLTGTNIPFIEISTKDQLDEIVLAFVRTGIPNITLPAQQNISLEEALKNPGVELPRNYVVKTLVLDQLTSMYAMILGDAVRTVARRRFLPEIPDKPDYGTAHTRFVNAIFDINKIPKIHKVYIALAEMDEDELTKERTGLPMVPGKMAREVLKFVDFVFRMHTRRAMEGNKLREFRAFQTQPEGSWIAKDSSGKLPKPYFELPSPDYDFFNETIIKSLLK